MLSAAVQYRPAQAIELGSVVVTLASRHLTALGAGYLTVADVKCNAGGDVSVLWRSDSGDFSAQVGGHVLTGWSSTAEEMQAILGRFGAMGSLADNAAVSLTRATYDCDGFDAARADRERNESLRRMRAVADGPERVVLKDALERLRSEIPCPGPNAHMMRWARVPDPGRELAQWLAGQVDRVNEQPPQVPQIHAFGSSSLPQSRRSSSARAQYFGWIDPVQVATTPDHERWGYFDRSERVRRSLDEFCVTLYAADTPAFLDAWIDRIVFGDLNQPVHLERVEGPAGPLFRVVGDGTHRAHLARVLGLPLFAQIQTSTLPTELWPIDRPSFTGAPFGRWKSLWEGLQRHGLLEIDVASAAETWTPTRMTAEWMLTDPESATAANRLYEAIYPGALAQVTGLTDAQLFSTSSWADTMVGPEPHIPGHGCLPPRSSARRASTRSYWASLRKWLAREGPDSN
ncbi:hypothetical protein [Nocardia vaccinii]|uniref:hypothetical protein n=1 Tax=Nocardia vaccinii TaxID=1822 RepID=UPI0012F48C05|nr:hypothetical protein [Nocardia vaccinii]